MKEPSSMPEAGPLRVRRSGPDFRHLERLVGDLLVEKELARTARDVIYRVRTGRGDRPLALKVALEPVEEEELARFQHEVRLLSEVRHPNVVEVYDFGVLPGGYPFLSMELLEVTELLERVREGDWQQFYDLALQAAAGLSHIHRHGIVHLDIKPRNLGAVERPGGELQLKILDFGLAQSVHGPLDRRIRGTLAYAAPEILLQDRYDHRADLYSLGLTLFQLATGVLPSAGDDMAAIRYHLQAEAPDPLTYRPDMPVALAAVLRRLLQRDPQQRFATAGQLLMELADAAGRKVDATSLGLAEGTVLASRMVGREAPLEELLEALSEAASGRGRVVLVEGREGVGKSRLLREFRLRAAMQGARVAIGRAAAGAPAPLSPLRGALARLGVELAAERPAVDAAGEERSELHRRIGAQLRSLGERGAPLVLLLDDLDLAGRESLDWFSSMAREVESDPCLLVGTCRSQAWRSESSEAPPTASGLTVIAVSPLDSAEVAELVDAGLGGQDLPEPFYDWVYESSGGLPGRAEQLLRHMVEEGVLQYRQGEWKPSLSGLARLASQPGGLEGLDRQRLAALPPAERRALGAAAVIAQRFPWETLCAVLEADSQKSYELLSSLVERGLLERSAEGADHLYGLSQPHLAELAQKDISEEDRRSFHLRVAELLVRRLEEGEEALVGAVAEHFWAAGERIRSLPYLLRAAEAAGAAYAHGEAAELFAAAAQVAQELGDQAQLEEIRLREAQALEAAGFGQRALCLYRECLDEDDGPRRRALDRRRRAELSLKVGRLHGRLGDAGAQTEASRQGVAALAGLDHPELELDLLQCEAEGLLHSGEVDAAFQSARRALRRATDLRLTHQGAALLGTLGLVFSRRRDWKRAVRLLRRGLRAASAAGAHRLASMLRNHLAEVYAERGDQATARELAEENLRLAEATNDPWGQLTSLQHLAVLAGRIGRWKDARQPLQRSMHLRRRLNAGEGEANAWILLGEIEEMLGDWQKARRRYVRALKLVKEVAASDQAVAVRVRLSSLARKRGERVEAEELAQWALSTAESLAIGALLSQCHHQLGLVQKDRGRWVPAAAHLGRALELAKAANAQDRLATLHNSLADLALKRRQQEEAEEQIEAARSWAERRSDLFEEGKALAAAGRLALMKQDTKGGDELLALAVKRFEELEVPFEYALSLYEWGLRTNSPEIAVERLDRALVAFDRLGAATEIERTRGVMEGIRERDWLQLGRAGQPGLWEVAKVANSTLDLQEVLDRTMDLVLKRLKAERGMIVLSHELTGELEVAVSRNLAQEDRAEGQKLSETVVRQVIEDRQPVLSVDALTDPRFSGAESIVASNILSILCVPLAVRDRLAGAIYVDHCRSRHLFMETDLAFLMAFADQAGIAIDNARLYGELGAARERLKAENESLRREILSSRHLGSLIGQSRAIAELKQTLERLAQSHSTVLIRGESGTGKGLVARMLHNISPRRGGPFIHFNCAALPESLAESELFGHEKGAFTGATGQKAGRFELAHRGTIFLDEIGKVAVAIQAKLLRVVEEKEFERVGGTRTLRSDVRIICATNLNLEEAIATGEFREDLYYRLNIIPIVLPPLRERREDIPYLMEHFIQKISRDLGQEPKRVDPGVLELFSSHRWPGNVRELEAAIHRALVLTGRDALVPSDFAWIGEGETVVGAAAPPITPRLTHGGYQELLDGYDRQLIGEALEAAGGRIREAARALGIARNTLKAKMKRYGLLEEAPR